MQEEALKVSLERTGWPLVKRCLKNHIFLNTIAGLGTERALVNAALSELHLLKAIAMGGSG